MYRLTPKFKKLSRFVNLTAFIIITGLYMYFFKSGCFILYFLMFGIFSISRNFRALEEETIYISDKTIEYRQLGSSFEVQWGKIEKISQRWHLYKQDCLIIDNSNIRIKDMSFWGSSFTYNLFDWQEIFIPLTCFSENWRDSELGQKIKQYAPHLFQ